MVFRNQDLGARCAHCYWALAAARASPQTDICFGIYLYCNLGVYTNSFKLQPQTTGFILAFSPSISVTPFSYSERPGSRDSKRTHFFDQAPVWSLFLSPPPHADSLLTLPGSVPSLGLPRARRLSLPPPGLRVLTVPYLALPPFMTSGQDCPGKEQEEKERRKGGGGGKRSGSARGTWRRSGRASYIFLASVFSPLEHCILHHHFRTFVYIAEAPAVQPPLHPSLYLSFCIGRSICSGLRSTVCSSGPSSLSAFLRRLSCQKSMKTFNVLQRSTKDRRTGHLICQMQFHAIMRSYLWGGKHTDKCILLNARFFF